MTGTNHTRTNDEWVAALRGDLGPTAQKAAYSDLANYLYKVAYNYLRGRQRTVPGLVDKSAGQLADLAEEFTQDTLEKIALRQLYNEYLGKGRFISFMAAVAINEIRQNLRRKQWQVYTEPLPPSDPEYDSESNDSLPPLPSGLIIDPESDLHPQLEEIWDTIRRCVEQLPERRRRAFVSSVFEDRPIAEVKGLVNAQSATAVHLLVHRARSEVKECLAEAGWDLDDIWRLFN